MKFKVGDQVIPRRTGADYERGWGGFDKMGIICNISTVLTQDGKQWISLDTNSSFFEDNLEFYYKEVNMQTINKFLGIKEEK